MSVVILGGNECMERRYMELCRQYNHRAKVFTRAPGGLKNKLGQPDLMIFFTGTMSHKMLRGAMNEIKHSSTLVEHSKSSSLSALRSILEKHRS